MTEDAFTRYLTDCLTAEQPELDKGEVLSIVKVVFEAKPRPSSVDLTDLDRRIKAVLPDGKDRVDLVYGGVTKVKGYVFEAEKLPEIRGASAILDWLNEVQLPALWGWNLDAQQNVAWGEEDWDECGIVYASGGNILAFTRAGAGNEKANRIETLYTEHTLTANSAAVSATFSLLELRYGRLRKKPDGPYYWIEDFLKDWDDPTKHRALKHYYYPPEPIDADDTSPEALQERFFNRKTFGELVTVLATMFNRRRDERASPAGAPGQQGAHEEARQTRFLPFFPALPPAEKCASSGMRPAVLRANVGEDERIMSEPSARKRYVGQIIKGKKKEDCDWFHKAFHWKSEGIVERSWEREWRKHLEKHDLEETPYTAEWHRIGQQVESAQDVHEIGASSKGYIGFIYADGNNIGRLIATLKTPREYAEISNVLRKATRKAVFTALAKHLKPEKVRSKKGGERYVHPFEILTIGGDDLFLIVPANRACDIALTIGYEFERYLAESKMLEHLQSSKPYQGRYRGNRGQYEEAFSTLTPRVGLSAGVVIAQENAPFFFLRDLVEELLKSAKGLAKQQVKKDQYYGGAIDFMVLKSITMVADNIKTFRREAFGIDGPDGEQAGDGKQERKYHLTARPYSWRDFAGLIATLRELKRAGVPRSQLYRLRGILQETHSDGVGMTRSVLEYLHTRIRFRDSKTREALKTHIEDAWCTPDEPGNASAVPLPPWRKKEDRIWETVWTDLVELYDMIDGDTDENKREDKG